MEHTKMTSNENVASAVVHSSISTNLPIEEKPMFTNVEEILDKLSIVPSLMEFEEAIKTLAREIKTLKRATIENKLLVEHEERVRTTKKPPTKIINGVKFKRGDIVYRLKNEGGTKGTIKKVNGTRALVTFADKDAWVDTRSLMYTTRKAG